MKPRFPTSGDTNIETSGSVQLTGKRKKRQWFEERYGTSAPGVREVKSLEVCKFYASSGNCRNGDKCKFVHDKSGISKIKEPCRFLYDSATGCRKGQSCHFSHDIWNYPCPLAFGGIESRCPIDCGFRHDSLSNERACMDFVRLYRQYLTSLAPESVNPRWRFYLEEEDESVTLSRSTRQSHSNLFNHQVGTLPCIPRIVLDTS